MAMYSQQTIAGYEVIGEYRPSFSAENFLPIPSHYSGVINELDEPPENFVLASGFRFNKGVSCPQEDELCLRALDAIQQWSRRYASSSERLLWPMIDKASFSASIAEDAIMRQNVFFGQRHLTKDFAASNLSVYDEDAADHLRHQALDRLIGEMVFIEERSNEGQVMIVPTPRFMYRIDPLPRLEESWRSGFKVQDEYGETPHMLAA